MTTKITADNIAANTITLAQLAPGAISELGAGGGGGGGGGAANLTATAYFEGSIGLQSTIPRWYPNRPIIINKSISRVITAGTDPLSFRILKSDVLAYTVSFGGLGPSENNTPINMDSNDYITIEITGTGIGAKDLYVSFLYNEV